MSIPIPLPGTPEARLLGCTCPVMDNRGKPLEWRIVNEGCPVHDLEKKVLDPGRKSSHMARTNEAEGQIAANGELQHQTLTPGTQQPSG